MNEQARDLLQAWYAVFPATALHLRHVFKYVRENASDPSAFLLQQELRKILPPGRAKLSPVTVARYLQKIMGEPMGGLVVSRRWDSKTKSHRYAVSPPGAALDSWLPRKYRRAPKVIAAEKVEIAEARAVAVQVMERRAAEPLPVAPGPVGLTAADRKTINSFKVPAPEPVPLATAMHRPPAVRDERYAGIGTIPQEVSSGEFNRAWNDHQARERLNGPPRRRWTPFDV